MKKSKKRIAQVIMFSFVFSLFCFSKECISRADSSVVCNLIPVGMYSVCGESIEIGSYSIENYGTECTTYERCNICGNNYNDKTVCIHDRDVVYGGDICYTYTVTICNICGSNYSGCSHSAGDFYGEVQCNPSDITFCSICGNNYNECSHKEGEVYNPIICTTTEICNICGCEYSGCPHQRGEFY